MSPAASANLRVSLAAATVAVALLLGAVGLMLWDTRKTAWTRAAESLANLTLSLEHDLSRSLEYYEGLVDAVAEGRQPVEGPLGADTRWRQGSDRLESDLFGNILVTDAEGRVVRSSRPIAAPLDLAALPYFTRQRDRADLGVVFGEAERGRLTDRPKLSFSRRIASPDGRFAGVVVGNVKLDYFKQAFANFQLGPGGTIALLSADGRLVAGSPMRETSAGLDLSASAVMQRLKTAGPGIFQARSIVDGQTRLYSARALARLPFYMVAGTSVRGVYADWITRLWATCGAAAGFLALLGFVALALRRELRRRAEAERQAQASAVELKLITDTIDDLILKIDWEGKRRYVSPASLQLLGVSAQELEGGDAFALVHSEDRQKLESAVDAMRSGSSNSHLLVYRVQHKDGTWRHVEARGRALPDGSGAIIVKRDVSERVQLEDQLRQAQRMDAIGQLTAGVAHDFNNLLQGQMASLELLLDRVERDQKAVQYAALALNAAERGAQLTHSLLAFSRKQVLRPEPVRLAELLARVSGLLSRTIDPKIKLRVEVQSDLVPPFADPAQLEAAVLNLCLNGRDAMQDRGGQLVIKASSMTESPNGAAGDGSRRCVVLSVTDDGDGMDSATIARAREPFFTTKGVGKGTGLGLSMVDGFARQSGGQLRIQSWPNTGTRVEIWLPEATAQARSPRDGAPKPTFAASGAPDGVQRVLLVDDNPGVLSMVGEMLGLAGFKVRLAANGEAALALLRENFDALVTDYAMPGMNGGELVGLARRSHPGLPALIITGYADDAQLVEVPAEIEVLKKPFRMDDLAGRLAVLIAGAKERRANTGVASDGARAGGDRLLGAAAHG